MQTFKHVASVLGLLFLITIVLAAIRLPGVEVKKYKLDYEVQSPEEKILKYQDKFLEDRAIMEKYDIFRGSKGDKDAGPFLNPLLNFDGTPRAPAKLTIPKELEKELSGKDWPAFEPDFKTLNLDFSWMKELHKYDHWSPDLNNPLIDPSKHPNISSLPLPNYRDLIGWAKLRWIHGRLTKDMIPALKDVRQLARLMYTNDYLVSSMVVVSLLRSEGKYIQGYNKKISDGWTVIPDEDLARARKYLWAISEVVDPRLSNETYERLTNTNVGQCQMISEGMLKNLVIRDELKKEYPGEIKRFDETVKTSLKTCRKSLVHMMWEDPTWTILGSQVSYAESFVKPENESDLKWKFLQLLPRMREIYTYYMLTIATPDYFRQYEEKGTSPRGN